MKKTVISMLTLCLLAAGTAKAQDTDISMLDNVIYLAPNSTVNIGEEGTLSLWMKNSAEIRGFQFQLHLPDGISAVKSAKGKIQGFLSEGRLPDEDEHDLTFSEHDDAEGKYVLFLCGSQYEETFTGNDGELLTLKVNVGEIEPGTYPVTLKKMKLSENDIRNYYEHDNIVTMLEVTLQTGIREIGMESRQAGIYDLAGQRVDRPMKGISICNGRKVLVR